MRHEWLGEVELARETGGTPDDHAADVVTPDIARDDPVGNKESSGSHVVGNHAVGRKVGGTFRFGLPGEALSFIQKWLQQIRFVVAVHALDN